LWLDLEEGLSLTNLNAGVAAAIQITKKGKLPDVERLKGGTAQGRGGFRRPTPTIYRKVDNLSEDEIVTQT
jgi:hypothetical protein